jgi:isoleucyl-tRNA synthetase
MGDARAVVSLGLQVRTAAKIKVRQPLSTATVVVSGAQVAGLQRNLDVIREELNVHHIELVAPDHAERFVTFKLKPNFRALGARIGKHVQAVKAALEKADAGALRAELVTNGKAIVPGVVIDGAPLEVTPDEIEVQVLAREGFAAAGDRVGVVVLDTRITPELKEEGIARELVNRLQAMRKEMGLDFQDRVVVSLVAPRIIVDAAGKHERSIVEAVLCARFDRTEGDAKANVDATTVDVEGHAVAVQMKKA